VELPPASKRLIEAIPFLIALGVWWAISRLGVDSIFLPSPEAVFRSLVSLVSSDFVVAHLAPSALRVAAAFLLSAAIAVPLGVAAGQIPAVRQMVVPLFSFFRYLPVAAIVPLCILWFGLGHEQKIAVITIGVVFQLVLLITYDSSAVPVELIETARTFGLPRWRVLTHVIFPAAAPAIWDHLRISAGWAWSYVVLAELVAGNAGVGYYVVQSQRYLETDRVFAGILVIGLVGWLTDLAFRRVGDRLFAWT
jgi:NitT/TauT family transport system permease protein